MIAPVKRSAESRPPVDAARDDVPEFDAAPRMFRSRRSDLMLEPAFEPGANGFAATAILWAVGFGLGAILVGFGVWLGMVLS